jgi:hypothetical protein
LPTMDIYLEFELHKDIIDGQLFYGPQAC